MSYFLFVCVLGLIYSEYLLFNCFVVIKNSPKFLFIYVKEVLPAESKAVVGVLFIVGAPVVVDRLEPMLEVVARTQTLYFKFFCEFIGLEDVFKSLLRVFGLPLLEAKTVFLVIEGFAITELVIGDAIFEGEAAVDVF